MKKITTGQSNTGLSETGLRRMRDVLARHVESGKIPGLVALVSRYGETHVEAIGTMRHDGGAPMRRDTIFRLASTSKPLAVASVMILLDECKLHLDDPVDTWLPELADRQVLKRADGPLDDTVPARRPITVRDLLTSTFGLGVDITLMGSPIQNAIFESGIYDTPGAELPEPDEWMRRLGTLPLSYQPGERWQYHVSNEVLGVLVARVTGQTFETFLRERILDPLGMKDTGFYVPANKIDRLPPAFNPDPQTGEFIVWDEAAGGRYSRPPAFQAGGGGLLSTVDDYHAYLRMLLNQGMHGTERILSRPAVQLMTTNRLTPEQQAARDALAKNNVHLSHGQGQHGGWGFGMAVRTYRGDYASIGQFGWDGGTGTTTYADPDKQLIGILLTQVGMSTPDSARLIHDFWTMVYQAIED
ncbi:serine hydrolase domain-containing protein [Peribacillus simplex]|uniref:serine hydrolase domain-containing protein n=1 Tax=Peribacillus simplex TaxID=1478 RepID=UPI0024C1E815|nr:serine hydrolase domain-containing protein [Peribacillus simplex]WHX89412.1 serine hydrolase domain-containing protein [Peribacillus simplex]